LRRPRGGGLRGGRWAERGRRVTLTRFTLVPGVTLSGRITNPEGRPTARLRVGGRAGLRGTLILRRGRLTGRLGGRKVSARFVPPRQPRGSGD
jgi:hypothetical protein